MTTADAFLADILLYPDDDAPRLIFADWLDEHGDPDRAEFIRVQCALARLGPQQSGITDVLIGHYNALRRHERELLRTHLKWSDDVAAAMDCPGVLLFTDGTFGFGTEWCWSFCRGFVESVTLTAEAWSVYADALLATAPIREVWLTTCPIFGADDSFPDGPTRWYTRWPGLVFRLPD